MNVRLLEQAGNMRNKVPNNRLVVAVTRCPFAEKTNTLEMPKNKTVQKRKQGENIKVNSSVPYSQSSRLNNIENIKPKCTSSENKDTFIEIKKVKRISKKVVHCPCCPVETVSHDVPGSSKSETSKTTFKKTNVKLKDASKNINNEKCQDPLFNMECKVHVERANIQKYLKPVPWTEENQKHTRNDDIPRTSSKIQEKIVNKDVNKTSQAKPLVAHKELTVPLPRSALFISLRRQERPNYAEITLNSFKEATPKKLPDIQQTCATKVPVYRQKLQEDKFKKPDRLYDFDESDPDINLQHKKRKRNIKKTNTKPISSIYTIFQSGNFKQKPINRNKKAKRKAPIKKYDDIMQEVVQRVMKKVGDEPLNKNLKVTVEVAKQGMQNAKNNVNMQRTVIPKIDLHHSQDDVINTTVDTSIIHADNIVTHNQSLQKDKNAIPPVISYNKAPNKNTVIQSGCKSKDNVNNVPRLVEETRASDFDDLSRSLFERSKDQKERTAVENAVKVTEIQNIPLEGCKSPSLHPHIDESFSDHDNVDNNDHSSDEDNLDDSFLDFGNNVHFSTPLNQNPRINIIGNVVLRKKIWSRNQTENPWRFSQAVTRNPHFIILKSSALPCLKQDMVLDHEQVEKIEEHFSKTPRRFGTPKKSPVQTSILNYVNSPNRHDKENAPRPSLFDYDDFSPVKAKSPLKNNADKVKRKILGPIQDNTSNILPFTSTPTKPFGSRQPLTIREENDDIENCFGFDVTGSPIPREKNRPSEARPFRIKDYVFKKLTKEIDKEKDIQDVPIQEMEPDESQAGNGDDSGDEEVHIFDDPEKAFSLTVPSKIYYRKPRRKRLKSVDVDNEEEHLPKKRKKDMMTKAEEAAMEDWAAKFNSMCREIEKYDLEIE